VNERSPLPEILERPPSGRVLLVAPHADDDVLGCGGTVSLHAAQGDPVHVLIVFSGEAGDPDRRYDREEYVERRRREALAAGAHLGLSDYEFWDYPEGHEPPDGEVLAVARRLAGRVLELRPDVVYAPWIGEYHVDHWIAARVVRMALALVGFRGDAWGYEVWTPLVPTRIVDISSRFEAKKRALEEHASQFEYHDMVHKTLAITAQRAMYISREARHGEAFAPLGPPSESERRLVEAVQREDAG